MESFLFLDKRTQVFGLEMSSVISGNVESEGIAKLLQTVRVPTFPCSVSFGVSEKLEPKLSDSSLISSVETFEKPRLNFFV
jgi:hypothetical protein